MNTTFKAALISAVVAAAAIPALAQAQGFDHGPRVHAEQSAGFVRPGFDLLQRIEQLENRIDRSRMNGSISRREARGAKMQLSEIRHDLTRATRRSGRLTPAMYARFDQRLDRLGGSLRTARNDDNFGRPNHRG